MKYNYRLFYQSPPLSMNISPEKYEFQAESFEKAYSASKKYMKSFPEGTIILLLAQLNR